MRRIFSFVASGIATGVAYSSYRRIHAQTLHKQEDISLDYDPKDLEAKYGYDISLTKLGNYSLTDQHKLSPSFRSRAEHLSNLKDSSKVFDLLIIGGGCNGGGTLLEASTRGLNCALIDRGDFASETSSRSTKLIHGGVRYLEEVFRLERGLVEKFKLVVEGLNERNFMLNTAPYMNKKIDIVVPCPNTLNLLYYSIGIGVYHFLSYFKWLFTDYTYKLPRPSFVSKNEMKNLFPVLKGDNYGVKFAEGQTNDSRLLIQTVLTSSQDDYVPNMKGATVANYVEFVDFIKDKEGKCIGAKLKDRIDNSIFKVKAKAIVNCAGIFADKIRTQDDPKAIPRIVGSRGVHLTFPRKYTEKNLGLLIPKTADGRVMFILPYRGMTIAGTTDHRCDLVSTPIAPEEDIKEISKELSNYFHGDLENERTAAWCGIRPLVLSKPIAAKEPTLMDRFRKLIGKDPTKITTKSLTRTHEVEVSPSGLISLMGGKWTSYRRMGQDAVEAVLQHHPEIVAQNKSLTRNIRLIGSYTTKTIDRTERSINGFVDAYKLFLTEKYSLEPEVAAHLVEQYGTNSVNVASLGNNNKLNERIHTDAPVIKAQVIHAVRHEMGTNVRDVLFRRLGVGFANRKTAEEMIPAVADLMATELQWNAGKKQLEIDLARKNLLTLG